MVTKKQKNILVVVVILSTLFVWGPRTASAATHLGAGIWQYMSYWSISLVNLTDYPLTYMRNTEPDAYGYPWVGNTGEPMLDAGKDWQVDPYRTKMWLCDRGFIAAPIIYDGRITLYSKGFKDWAFDLVFEDQKADGVLEHGTWIALSPHEKTTQQGWAPANTWAYGRWATPVNDLAMHNVMTLIGPKLMVTLYTANSVDLVVVVQQLKATDETTGNVIWDDTGDTYRAYKLDFVDRGSTYVP